MRPSFWNKKKVLVTGGAGFIGSYLVEKLLSYGADVTVLDNFQSHKQRNLMKVIKNIRLIKGDIIEEKIVKRACKGQEIVMNLAAKVGGIEYNRTHQGTMLYQNLLIPAIMIEAARKAGVERFLVVSSACIYPRDAIIPTPEEEGFRGEPEPTNSGYGWGKRMAELLGKYYCQEFGMKVSVVRPYNCYGPRDHFDQESSHVIPALIKRIYDGENPLIVWGSGNQTRAFLYVEDLVDGMIAVIERFPHPDPINIGTDEEISIKSLVKKIISLSDLHPQVIFDTSKPDGSIRRNCNNKKAWEKIGFHPKVHLEDGLKKTIQWYQRMRNND